MGGEFSGSIVEVGENVEDFQIGKKVFGTTLGIMPKGAWAEYALCDKNNIVYKPHNLTDFQAAVLPLSGIAALAGVEKAKIRKGDKVLIYGASGGVGLYVLQLVKAKDAQITAVYSSRNIELVKSYGVDSVIDYLSEDFTKCGKLFDKIISVNGYNPVKTYKNLLKVNGIYVAVGNAKQLFHTIFASCLNPISNRKVLFSSSAISSSDSQLSSIKEMAEQGLYAQYLFSATWRDAC
ncbi:NAD(P)-dependent alcohol dehydrogenase [Bacillus sp. 03113]|uniref:NAD(P)-dependent alcohol dehydrogenase n=1 Tax=Bacillus sp. 03113 TaxID=2578211 RepID=UPI0011415DC6|nr:NAD(P)-dependent alcohol dehydrogenase [Bacillus sp. 03113]